MFKQKELIAYCGLCCGDCFSYKGRVAELSKELRKELRQAKFDKIAAFLGTLPFFKALQDYQKCYEVLGVLVRLRCKKSCRDGGGNPFCKIRQCCQKRKLKGCWQCDEITGCKKLDFLTQTHNGAHIKNLKIIKKQGEEAFLKAKRYW
ncbi:MAG: DUF3795 domain-containing protein [Candidatus Omnitrophota bacterium]